MRDRFKYCLVVLTVLLATAAVGDNLSGADQLLCSSVQATVCSVEGQCEIGPPWNWNIPQFIEIDLDKQQLRTTRASGQNRSTPIKNFERENGMLFIQGVQNGRAFSVLIDESSGETSIAVARPGIVVSVFAACTPISSN